MQLTRLYLRNYRVYEDELDLALPPGLVGIYGDKLGETGYYGDGVMYNYNFGKVAARLYELPK